MKKWVGLYMFLLAGILLVGCGSKESDDTNVSKQSEESAPETAATENNTEVEEVAEEPQSNGLQLLENEKVDKYLADANGMTLYYFANDEPNVSNCSGECLEKWPVFYEENFEVPEGFNKDDFSSITREDNGEKQTTFKGYPLYYFVNDKASGDVNGQGVKDVWFVVNNETTFSK